MVTSLGVSTKLLYVQPG